MKAMKSQKSTINQEKEVLDPMALMQTEFIEKYIVAQISLYIALHYIHENNMVKQALVIL